MNAEASISRIERRCPFGISVITSWWQPTIEPAAGGNNDEGLELPSVQASMSAGIPALDYYFFGLGEDSVWKKVIPTPKAGDLDFCAQIAALPATMAPRIRGLFRRMPCNSQVFRGSASVIALATHVKAISRARASLTKFARAVKFEFGESNDRYDKLVDELPSWKLPKSDKVSEPENCPLVRLKAALAVAWALRAPVVEVVGGLKTDPLPTQTAVSSCAGEHHLWADHFLGEGDSESPEVILVENLFRLAGFILTELPVVRQGLSDDQRERPPVTMALEIEPGAGYILNDLQSYTRIKTKYMQKVEQCLKEVNNLAEDDRKRFYRVFQAFHNEHNLTEKSDEALRKLYADCIGLNVDVGHMFLLNCQPGDVSPFMWTHEVEPKAACDLLYTSEIVHYHLSDHRGAHYCDLPPGHFHSPLRFEQWIRQAYALAQLEKSDRSECVHPNFTRHMAIELETCVLGADQVASTFVRTQRWLRHCLTSAGPLVG